MPENVQILVTTTTRASPGGVNVHRYVAGETYGPETEPPMPADLAATFLRERWGEVDGEQAAPPRVHVHTRARACAREGPTSRVQGNRLSRRPRGRNDHRKIGDPAPDGAGASCRVVSRRILRSRFVTAFATTIFGELGVSRSRFMQFEALSRGRGVV